MSDNYDEAREMRSPVTFTEGLAFAREADTPEFRKGAELSEEDAAPKVSSAPASAPNSALLNAARAVGAYVATDEPPETTTTSETETETREKQEPSLEEQKALHPSATPSSQPSSTPSSTPAKTSESTSKETGGTDGTAETQTQRPFSR